LNNETLTKYSLDYTRPDLYTMPQLPELVATILFAVLSAGLLIYAVVLARREHSWLPVLIFFGSGITMFLEAIALIMGNASHSQIGQMNMFTVKGHPLPLYVLFAYPPYYGLIPLLMYQQFKQQTIERVTWWKLTAVAAVGVIAIEQIPIWLGLWHFYGVHPIRIGLMPIHMIAMNLASVMSATLVFYAVVPLLKGWRQLMTLFIFPIFAVGGHAGSGFLAYNVMGSKTELASPMLIHGTGLFTVVMLLVMIRVLLLLIYGERENLHRG
jgi:hypothetical protein